MIRNSNADGALHPSGRPLRVLVIDDDDIACDVMVDLLNREGYEVSSIMSPIGATQHILASDVQVVVIDVMMPAMRGDKLAALLGRHPRLRNLGVVLITGAPTSELEKLASELSQAVVVQKTDLHMSLGAAVRRVVKVSK
jgi:CheY-like chemotaxis protein